MSRDPVVVVVDRDLEELIPVFMANRRKDLEELGQALSTTDLEQVRFISHRLKGAAGSYGFSVIEELAQALEFAADGGDLAGATRLVETYRDLVESLDIRFT